MSLVTELDDINPEDSAQVVDALGRVYQKLPHYEQSATNLFRRWPAAHVIGMSGFAAVGYHRGNFWSGFWEQAGVRGGQIDQQRWGQSFLANLRQLGLPVFADSDDVGTQYVGRILMHAGIPTYCLGDFFRLCVERRRLVADLEAESFVAWAAERAQHGRLAQVDRPVSRFLTHGGAYAVDLVDRSFELLDRLSARQDVGDFRLLPRRFVEYAQEHVASGDLDPAPRRIARSASTASSGQPFLKLDPWGVGIFVQLPAVGDMPDGSATWVVTVDGEPAVIKSRPLWPSAAEQAPETSFFLRRPARDVVVSLQGHERLEYALSVLGDDRLLLAFDEDGKSVPEGLPLPSGPVWLVYPDSLTPRIDGTGHVLATGQLPLTWAGWSVELWDLTTVSAVMCGDVQRRLVRHVASVRLNLGVPISGVRTAYGSPVYASRPSVELPAGTSADISWQITVTRAGDEVALARRQGNDGQELDRIWDDLPRPLLGAFDVQVRGPLGRGARRRAFLAEGLAAQSRPPWRRFDRGGLISAEAMPKGPAGMSVDPSPLTLGPRDVRAFVTVVAGEESEPLTIEPPHMTVAFESPQRRTEPSVSAVPLVLEEIIDDPGILVADLHVAAEPMLHVLSAGGATQVVAPSGAPVRNRYRFDLARVLDTLRDLRVARLALDPDGHTTIATVRPRQLAADVMVEEDHLSFTDFADASGIVAAVYATRAPWREPWLLDVSGGRAFLPEELRCAGPLRVMLRVDDPWAPEPWPKWPGHRQSMRADAEGWFTAGDEEETELSAFLAGAAEMASDLRDLTRVWRVLHQVGGLHLEGSFARVIKDLRQVLHRNPTSALLHLGESGLTREETVRLVVSWGLASVPTPPPDPQSLASLWRRQPVLAALVGSELLSQLDTTAGSDLGDVLEAAAAAAGAPLVDILHTTVDPCPEGGRFDATTDRLELLPPEAVAIALAASNLVPKGLLHVDGRATAATQLFLARHDERLNYVCRSSARIRSELQLLINRAAIPGLGDALRAREHPGQRPGWRELPVVSLGMAIVARLAARGDAAASAWLNGAQRSWEDLTLVAPDIVATDLVLAETLICSHERAKRRLAS